MKRKVSAHGVGHKAAGVDVELKGANQKRLRRIEGQIRGLQKMVEEDRYCADVIVQIASVQEALRGVARNLMKNHIRHCAAKAMGGGKKEEKEAMYEELLGLMALQQR
ncbi:MAG: metal-sensitive transcriptional regulator [Acidobacteria bacterium]|nr:metal-sensitive transcriptional regulator [Acidobacteriota bacterium]MBS1865719.1 metal-sensitive transcriptional regulator [Acidobacteriota bacterium]